MFGTSINIETFQSTLHDLDCYALYNSHHRILRFVNTIILYENHLSIENRNKPQESQSKLKTQFYLDFPIESSGLAGTVNSDFEIRLGVILIQDSPFNYVDRRMSC